MGVSVVRMRPLWTDDIPSNFLKVVHKRTFLVRAGSPRQRPLRRQHAAHSTSHVNVWTSLWTSPAKKKRPSGLPQGGQGRRSRGGHVWPPGLDGPGTFTDTMDEAGPLGPAWKRLCHSPRPGGSTRASLQAGGRCGVGKSSHQGCNCVLSNSGVVRRGVSAFRRPVPLWVGSRGRSREGHRCRHGRSLMGWFISWPEVGDGTTNGEDGDGQPSLAVEPALGIRGSIVLVPLSSSRSIGAVKESRARGIAA